MAIRHFNLYTLTQSTSGDITATETSSFTGNAPRQAANKACNRDHRLILLRETGTNKIHVFTGERVQGDRPLGAPDWLPDKIWYPKVHKVGIIKFSRFADILPGLPEKAKAMLGA